MKHHGTQWPAELERVAAVGPRLSFLLVIYMPCPRILSIYPFISNILNIYIYIY